MSNATPVGSTIVKERRRGGCLAWLAVLLLIVAGLPVIGAIYETVAENADAQANPPPGQLVDVGGFRLHLNCSGSGSPTVVIDAGLGNWSTSWSLVQPEVARTTRVCTYDRAGNGWSEPGPQPRSAQRFVTELHTLLQQAHVPGPYVIAGHSLGGYTARLFAHTYPAEVAGVVLIEATHPSDDAVIPNYADSPPDFSDSMVTWLARVGVFRVLTTLLASPDLPPAAERAYRAISVRPQYFQIMLDEARALPEGSVQVRAVQSLGDVPLIVLTRSKVDSEAERLWQKQQAELLNLSTRSEQLFAEKSGHNVEIDQPEAAVAALVKMAALVRAAGPK